MTITPEQLEALQLAHDAVRASADDVSNLTLLSGCKCCGHDSVSYSEEYKKLDTALDTLTAAIENLKGDKK